MKALYRYNNFIYKAIAGYLIFFDLTFLFFALNAYTKAQWYLAGILGFVFLAGAILLLMMLIFGRKAKKDYFWQTEE